jgi:magnesium chelatase family protein
MPSLVIVGLPDKLVSEARERVRPALTEIAVALPSKRITVKLSPAGMPQSRVALRHPIALALLAAIEVLPREQVARLVALGELSLGGARVPVIGALPAAMPVAEEERTLLCPRASGAEAA